MLVTTANRFVNKSVRRFSTNNISPEAMAGITKVKEQREKYFKNHTQGKLYIFYNIMDVNFYNL